MELFWYDIRDLDRKAYKEALGLLDKDRKKRVKRMAGEDDKKRTVMGEYMLRTALSEKTGVAKDKIVILRDDSDKPYVENCAYHFSISHSGNYVLLAMAEEEIGVDIEEKKNVEEKFVNRVCTEEEQAYVRFGFGGYLDRFWECWTAKEALFKLTGEGSLLSQSRMALPEGVVLEQVLKDGYSVTIARKIS